MSVFRRSNFTLQPVEKALKPPRTQAEENKRAMMTANNTAAPQDDWRKDKGAKCPQCGHRHKGGSICSFNKAQVWAANRILMHKAGKISDFDFGGGPSEAKMPKSSTSTGVKGHKGGNPYHDKVGKFSTEERAVTVTTGKGKGAEPVDPKATPKAGSGRGSDKAEAAKKETTEPSSPFAKEDMPTGAGSRAAARERGAEVRGEDVPVAPGKQVPALPEGPEKEKIKQMAERGQAWLEEAKQRGKEPGAPSAMEALFPQRGATQAEQAKQSYEQNLEAFKQQGMSPEQADAAATRKYIQEVRQAKITPTQPKEAFEPTQLAEPSAVTTPPMRAAEQVSAPTDTTLPEAPPAEPGIEQKEDEKPSLAAQVQQKAKYQNMYNRAIKHGFSHEDAHSAANEFAGTSFEDKGPKEPDELAEGTKPVGRRAAPARGIPFSQMYGRGSAIGAGIATPGATAGPAASVAAQGTHGLLNPHLRPETSPTMAHSGTGARTREYRAQEQSRPSSSAVAAMQSARKSLIAWMEGKNE